LLLQLAWLLTAQAAASGQLLLLLLPQHVPLLPLRVLLPLAVDLPAAAHASEHLQQHSSHQDEHYINHMCSN
jgi:hypothetical protein